MNLAQAYNALEDFDKAANYYEEANADLHHEPAFMKEYGIFLREEGRLPEALHLLQHYLAHEPGDLSTVDRGGLIRKIGERNEHQCTRKEKVS